MNVWGHGYTEYPDLSIIMCACIEYHTEHHKYVQILGINWKQKRN